MAVPEKSTTEAEATPQTETQTYEPPTTKQRMFDAAGVVATAVTVGLYQSGHLGSAPLSLQITCTVAGISAAPTLYRAPQTWRVSPYVRGAVIVPWLLLCFLPTLFALLTELFTGHRRPGATFFDAMWRIYAILALWIAFAVANERVIKPWWDRVSDRWFGEMRKNSIPAQNRQRAMDRRTAALEGIKARVVLALRRKKRTEHMVEKRDADIEEAVKSVKEAEELLDKARLRAGEVAKDGGAGEAQKADAEEKVERMSEMVQTARLHERTVRTDLDRSKSELASVEDDLKMLQHEWTTALHIENHVEFAR